MAKLQTIAPKNTLLMLPAQASSQRGLAISSRHRAQPAHVRAPCRRIRLARGRQGHVGIEAVRSVLRELLWQRDSSQLDERQLLSATPEARPGVLCSQCSAQTRKLSIRQLQDDVWQSYASMLGRGLHEPKFQTRMQLVLLVCAVQVLPAARCCCQVLE